MTFDKEVISAMAANNHRPIIVAASNPAGVGPSECASSQDVMRWSDGRAIFIPAKTFPGTDVGGRYQHFRGLSSSYTSPGIALGALLSGLTTLREDLFLSAADVVASSVSDEDRQIGSYFPALDESRTIAAKVAHSVMVKAYDMGIATNTPRPYDIASEIQSYMYQPTYRRYR